MLDVAELFELEDAIREELDERLAGILSRLNRTGELEILLRLLDMQHLLKQNSGYKPYKNGKIIVIGESRVKAEELIAVAKKYNIDKRRFEFYLDYQDAKTFNFSKMQYNQTYSAIMVGPMGHSGTAKGDHSSVITAIENEDGYPPVIRMGTNGLQISKSDFKNKLKEMLDTGIIEAA